MSKETSVDIIILSWDRVADTLLAIDSALSQEGINRKVIVVDQGSKPDGLKVLRKYCSKNPDVLLLCNGENSGVPGGRNKASLQGDGEYIVSLDNDAEFIDSHQIARSVEIMKKESELGALAFRILRFGSSEDDVTSWSYHQNIKEWSDKSFYTDRFVGAGHILSRKAFDEIGGYDDSLFFLHEEVDLSKRLINAGYKIRYTPEVVIGHKVSAEHRVAWNGDRWLFDIRNKTYLHLKFKTSVATAIFHSILMIWKGMRAGLYKATLKGFLQGIGMLPNAIDAWRTQPAVKTNEKSRGYMESVSPMAGMSVWERVKKRLVDNKPLPVKK